MGKVQDKFNIWNKENLEKVFDQIRLYYEMMNSVLITFNSDKDWPTDQHRDNHYIFFTFSMKHQIDEDDLEIIEE